VLVFYSEWYWKFAFWQVTLFRYSCSCLYLDCWTLKMGVLPSSEMSGTNGSTTNCYIPEDLNNQVHDYGIFIYQIFVIERPMKTFDHWEWNHYGVSERRTQIKQRRDAISQKYEYLNCTAAKTQNVAFNLILGGGIFWAQEVSLPQDEWQTCLIFAAQNVSTYVGRTNRRHRKGGVVTSLLSGKWRHFLSFSALPAASSSR
jgi:hypothetical protein